MKLSCNGFLYENGKIYSKEGAMIKEIEFKDASKPTLNEVYHQCKKLKDELVQAAIAQVANKRKN